VARNVLKGSKCLDLLQNEKGVRKK